MRDPAPWQKRYDNMWWMAIALGLIGQYLFVHRAAGISVPLFIALFYVMFFYATKKRIGGFDRWKGQSKTGWLLLGPIGLLAMTYALFANDLFRTLNVVVLFILIVAQTMLITRGGSQPWHRPKFLFELLDQWLIEPFAQLTAPFSIMGGWLRNVEDSEAKKKTRSNIGKIGMGLMIAAPLLFVVILLLASADGIFSSWINQLPSLMDGPSVSNGFARLAAAICIALYSFCYIWGLLFRKRAQKNNENDAFDHTFSATPWESIRTAPVEKSAFDPITALTVLISVNLVYVLFAVIQFTYLFGAADGLLPANTAYAEYARRGFAELVLISLINLGILLVGLHFVKAGSEGMEKLRKVMLSLLMGCTLVMLVSAYSRLSLYEEAYGYTELRLLVHGFMIFLGVIMVVAIVRIWYQWFSLAKIYIALAIVSYVIMNYANLDARIAANNIERYEATGKIDIRYLGTLSADAASVLKKFHEDHPELEGLDVILSKYEQQAEERSHWQSWSLALQRLK